MPAAMAEDTGASVRVPIYVAVIDFALTPESEFVAALERKLVTSHGLPA